MKMTAKLNFGSGYQKYITTKKDRQLFAYCDQSTVITPTIYFSSEM